MNSKKPNNKPRNNDNDNKETMIDIKKIDYLIKVNEIVKNTLKSIKEELNDFNF